MNTEQFYEGPGASPLTTYVVEIAIILLVAFILGYLLRLLLNDGLKDKISELEHENSMLKSRTLNTKVAEEPVGGEAQQDTAAMEAKLKQQTKEIQDLNDRLSECYGKRVAAENKLSQLQTKVDSAKSSESALNMEAEPIVASAPVVNAPVSNAKDSLRKIEGIGPKIEQLLHDGGVLTFTDLKNAKVERLKEILISAGPNYAVHDPSTWGEQSALAEAGKWEVLAQLQDELKGGKRK